MGQPEHASTPGGNVDLAIEDQAHMPVIRDLSATRRVLILAWIKNGCPEGGSDA
jgi:hypothetical protein